jgi:hypothetical protein
VRLIGVASLPSEQSYPINRLRNVAIRAVRTSHFLVLDVDTWPSASLATIITNLAPVALLKRKLAALVVPAFQLEEAALGDLTALATAGRHAAAAFARAPRTLAQLRACLGAAECARFYEHTSPETHASTPYDAWWRAAPGSEPLTIPCFQSPRYEPYLVLPNLPSTPRYAEQFTGYGKNKIQLVTHLRFAGFRFHALPGAYVVHMPHAKSREKLTWEAGPHRARMDQLYTRLVQQLVAKYEKPRTTSCTAGHML